MVKAEPKAPVNKHNTQKNNGSFFRGEDVMVAEQQPDIQPFFNYNYSAPKNNPTSFFNPSIIQPRLTIGRPGDKYEQEADVMADQVVQRMETQSPPEISGNNNGQPTISLQPLSITRIQRKPFFEKEADPGIQAKQASNLIQTKCAECETEEKEEAPVADKEVQMKSLFAGNDEPPEDKKSGFSGESLQRKYDGFLSAKSEKASTDAPESIQSRLSSGKGGGSSLPEGTRSSMESAFKTDFSGVRVHTDSSAVQMNRELQAQAFTHGSDIYFNQGKYNTHNSSGKHLLAHELTHTVQQASPSPAIQKQEGKVSNLDSLNEMLDRWNVPEEEVISICTELSEKEKATVRTNNTYKTRMANALNVGEMIRAVNNLGFSLETKLNWVKAGATFGTTFIEYSEIKAMVTGAPQSERDVLKSSTTAGKSFFVGVCTNETMIEGLNDLQFDLVTKLTWLKVEMMITSWELSYPTIQPWIVHANTTQTERDSLKTDAWKNFFVDVCTNTTMVEALNDLQYDMLTKLTWLHAEMTITSLELDYATIKPWITHASTTQANRDSLKTSTWRDFFVNVCNDTAIKEALEDLNFDFLTLLRWYLAEVNVSASDFTWLCNRFKVLHPLPVNEDTIACEIMKRELEDGTFDSSADHQPAAWANMAHQQFLVATQMGAMVGETATWSPSNPASGTNFQIWASAPVETPVPALSAMYVINCWEMVMLAAFRAGVLSWPRIHTLYITGAPDWFSFLVNELSFNNRIFYDTSAPTRRPVAGDIVFFDGASHIALAEGSIDGGGRTKIYSFWPPPNVAFTAGGTTDDVKITTIEELNDYWVGRGKPAFRVEYTTPNW